MLRPKLAGVTTTPVHGLDDVRGFFDRCASAYTEQHGHSERLLAYRLGLIRAHARLRPDDVVLDVGCGPGDHLVALERELRQGRLRPRRTEDRRFCQHSQCGFAKPAAD